MKLTDRRHGPGCTVLACDCDTLGSEIADAETWLQDAHAGLTPPWMTKDENIAWAEAHLAKLRAMVTE